MDDVNLLKQYVRLTKNQINKEIEAKKNSNCEQSLPRYKIKRLANAKTDASLKTGSFAEIIVKKYSQRAENGP